jgi:beta-galactosidase GanA
MRVELRDNYLWVGDQRVPLLTGEFHFWRNTRCHWPRILGAIDDLGFRHLTTYVQWNFHQVSPPGTPLAEVRYDFTGETDQQRDLVSYLDLLRDRGTWLSIRPGPYIYAETEFEGVPEDVNRYHRLHPYFLERARHYIQAVSEAFAPYQATRGGNIVMVQLDNESSMIRRAEQVWEGGPTDSGSFAQFLVERYGDLESVNAAYGTRWDDWEDAEPLFNPVCKHDFVAYLDVARFLEWYNARFFREIRQMYVDAGIDVPFYVNSTGPPFPHNPEYTDGVVDLRTADIYYMKTERLVNMLALNAKVLAATNPLTVCGEYRCGTTEMTAQDYHFQGMLWMMYGFHGVNYFMLVERHRWPLCPIDAVGRVYDARSYGALRAVAHAYNALDFSRFISQPCPGVQLVWYRPHAWAEKAAPAEPGFYLRDDGNNNNAFRALLYGNVPFEVYYPGSRHSAPRAPLLIYAGHSFCAADVGQDLAKYVEEGGHLVFVHTWPTKTEAGDPLDTFAFLPKSRGLLRYGEQVLVSYGARDRDSPAPTLGLQSPVYVEFDLHDAPAGTTAFWVKHQNAGYTLPHGRGHITVLGFDVAPPTIRALLQVLGHKVPYSLSDGACLTTCYSSPDAREVVAFVTNPTEEPRSPQLTLDLQALTQNAGPWTCTRLMRPAEGPEAAGRAVAVNLAPKSGEILWFRS